MAGLPDDRTLALLRLGTPGKELSKLSAARLFVWGQGKNRPEVLLRGLFVVCHVEDDVPKQ